MPQEGRQGPESFRYRSLISLDDYDESSDSLSRSRATVSDFSSLGSVDEHRASVPPSSRTGSAPPACRAAALKRLHQAASVGIVTNDLKPKRENDDHNDDTTFAVQEEIDGQDEVEEEQISREHSQSISTKQQHNRQQHKRNGGKYTIVAFINSKSGGGMGNKLYKSLQSHLGEEFVIDLHSCSPGNMPEDTLLKYAYDPMVRVLSCGGDGTCGWLYSSLDKVWRIVLENSSNKRVHLSKYKDHLPLAIIPLGTGNDLSRQYGWGGSFRSQMKDKSMISSVQNSKPSTLDRWRCIIMPVNALAEEEKEYIPNILAENYHEIHPSEGEEAEEEYQRRTTDTTLGLLQTLMNEEFSPKKSTKSSRRRRKSQLNMSEPSAQVFDGVFCNYFSIGFDATIAYHFHHEREEHPERFTSPLKNKIIYVEKSPAALRAPKLSKRVKILVNNEHGQLVKLKIPKSCRAIVSRRYMVYSTCVFCFAFAHAQRCVYSHHVEQSGHATTQMGNIQTNKQIRKQYATTQILLNIQSFAAGNRLTTKGNPQDALIEVIFVSNLMRLVSEAILSPIMPFLRFNVAAQTNNVCIRTKCPLHMEVDGEPWLQEEGVMQVKFHSRNSILEKIKDGINCGCMGGGTEETVLN